MLLGCTALVADACEGLYVLDLKGLHHGVECATRLHCPCDTDLSRPVCTQREKPALRRGIPAPLLCRYLFTSTGINACSYNTKVAGVYTLTFSVTNSQGMSASVKRTLVVEPVCPLGETLCSNKVPRSWALPFPACPLVHPS